MELSIGCFCRPLLLVWVDLLGSVGRHQVIGIPEGLARPLQPLSDSSDRMRVKVGAVRRGVFGSVGHSGAPQPCRRERTSLSVASAYGFVGW